ncbi:hypothetical protein [Bradyrhizobium elkanii]|uniref:hypothetical protein n=1 Tax=Bradyrhizobium elkanii TaxID=29448 RepID=UPI001BAD4C21|nr:hypothetical protein [Bradyrhizobium elkanii]MBR1161932.1 hypothetical protein [Bradyrhizobium elkanii]
MVCQKTARDQRIDISGSSNDSFIQMFEMQLPAKVVIPGRRISAEPGIQELRREIPGSMLCIAPE